MFLPIGDEPNPRGRPTVTWTLIGLNVAVFFFVSLPLMARTPDPQDPLLWEYVRLIGGSLGVAPRALLGQTSAYDLFVFEWGFKPAAPSLVTMFASLFLHGGWMHLLGNMLFLWIFGDNVEARLGSLRYLAAYLLTGVLATLFFAAFQLASWLPLVGASGAISGVLGCYFVWFPHNRVKVLAIIIWFVQIMYVPARWVLGFYLVVENLFPFVFQSSGSGVAYGAHIGGFLGGLGIAAWVDRKEVARKRAWRSQVGARGGSGGTAGPGDVLRAWWEELRERMLERSSEGGTDEEYAPRGVGSAGSTVSGGGSLLAERLADAVATLRWDDAVAIYRRMPPLERGRLSHRWVFPLADWLTEQGEFDGALSMLQRFIASNPSSPALARAHLRAGLILLRGRRVLAAAAQHLLTVLDLAPAGEVADAARVGLAEIEALQTGGRGSAGD